MAHPALQDRGVLAVKRLPRDVVVAEQMRMQMRSLKALLSKPRTEAFEQRRHRLTLELSARLADQEAVGVEAALRFAALSIVACVSPLARRSLQVAFA